MKSCCTLDMLPAGNTARVIEIKTCDIVARLNEMGVLLGEEVEILHRAPFGGPIALGIGNQTLALRLDEARLITVEVQF